MPASPARSRDAERPARRRDRGRPGRAAARRRPDPADLHRLILALKRAGAARATTMLRLQAIKPPAPSRWVDYAYADMLAVAAIAGCPIFPACNPWNQRVDGLPVHPRSDASSSTSALDETVHPDFGSGLWEGARSASRSTSSRATRSAHECVRVRGRVRSRAVPDPGLAADRGRRRPPCPDGPARDLPAVRAVRGLPSGASWRPGAGRSGTCARTSCARAAGPPPTRPACRSSPASCATTRSRRGEIRTRCASRSPLAASLRVARAPLRVVTTDPDLPAMGQRLRLKASVRRSRGCRSRRGSSRQALQRYGMLVADNGSDWYVSGAPDRAGTTTTCAR